MTVFLLAPVSRVMTQIDDPSWVARAHRLKSENGIWRRSVGGKRGREAIPCQDRSAQKFWKIFLGAAAQVYNLIFRGFWENAAGDQQAYSMLTKSSPSPGVGAGAKNSCPPPTGAHDLGDFARSSARSGRQARRQTNAAAIPKPQPTPPPDHSETSLRPHAHDGGNASRQRRNARRTGWSTRSSA